MGRKKKEGRTFQQVPKDKKLHAIVSFILVLIIAPAIGLIWASLAVIGLGILKEVVDHCTNGTADVWDFVADLVGVLVAFTVASHTGIG